MKNIWRLQKVNALDLENTNLSSATCKRFVAYIAKVFKGTFCEGVHVYIHHVG